MIALATRLAPRGSAARDLVAMWLTFAALFAYLDVPLQHAPLFATNLVLQSSLGGIVIVLLLRSSEPSLLLLCGPGLILGGALSFTMFQLSGRGSIGVSSTLAAGVAATLLLLRSRDTSATDDPRWWLLGQLTGMGCLAIAAEFTELLPLVVSLLIAGVVLAPGQSTKLMMRWTVVVLVGVTATFTVIIRNDDWWMVTDDYQFLEVLTRHITVAGPTATWGVESFAEYHWLSYGWAGILGSLSGGPQPFVTLTRVMPVVYSISLASSLLMIAKYILRGQRRAQIFLAVWSVIAVGNFEWTGTSTGGVFSVLAAGLATGMLVAQSRPTLTVAVPLLALFSTITALTKAPAVLGVALAMLAVVIGILGNGLSNPRRRLLTTAVGLAACLGIVMALIWTFGNVSDNRVQFVFRSYSLGQLSEFGPSFSGPALVLKRLFIWFPVMCGLAVTLRGARKSEYSAQWISMTLGVFAVTGLLIEVFVQSRANIFEYFSEPMYFLASLSLIHLGWLARSPRSSLVKGPKETLILIVSLSVGVLWGSASVREVFWDAITALVSDGASLKVELLKFATTDSRLAPVVVAAAAVAATGSRRRQRLFVPILQISLVTLSIGNLARPAIVDYREGTSTESRELIMGSDSVRITGEWLNTFTETSDLIATNHRADAGRTSEVDFALAVWARREFLSLGRTISTSDASIERTQASLASDEFANRPSRDSCERMRAYGVDWYVVNLERTEQRDWSICARQVFVEREFVVLALGSGK